MQTEFLTNGNTPTCDFFNNIFIGNDLNGNILLRRCCLQQENIFSIREEDFIKIPNLVEYLNTFTDKWGPTRSLSDCCWRITTLKECFTPTPPKRFTTFEISLDHSCNAKCEFCCQRDSLSYVLQQKDNIRYKNLYYSTLNKIVEQVDYPIILRLSDRGEPLFWKEEFKNFFKKALNNSNIQQIRLTTNGLNLLDSEIFSMFKEASATGRVALCCSISSLSEELHFKKMKIHHLWDIVNACNELNTFQFEYVVTGKEDLEEFEKNLNNFRTKTKIPIDVTFDNVSQNKDINKQVCFEIRDKFKELL